MEAGQWARGKWPRPRQHYDDDGDDEGGNGDDDDDEQDNEDYLMSVTKATGKVARTLWL